MYRLVICEISAKQRTSVYYKGQITNTIVGFYTFPYLLIRFQDYFVYIPIVHNFDDELPLFPATSLCSVVVPMLTGPSHCKDTKWPPFPVKNQKCVYIAIIFSASSGCFYGLDTSCL